MARKKKEVKTFFYNAAVTKTYLKDIIFWAFQTFGMERVGHLSDSLKTLGFHYSTKGGLSISIEDLKVPPLKPLAVQSVELKIEKMEVLCEAGQMTESEKHARTIENWVLISENLKNGLVDFFRTYDLLNPIYMMSFSGARGNLSQVRQLIGMRGLMADSSGNTIDIPITKNFREGLTITDYLISSYGARKGLVDTSLRTADSGYLTRRLIDVAQDVLIREFDCKTNSGILLFSVTDAYDNLIIPLKERLVGRILTHSLVNPLLRIKLANRGDIVSSTLAHEIEELGIIQVSVRSPLTCELSRAICQKCYGLNLAYDRIVDLGEAIGIISAQSIGEPGTQLTMRTFHTGGVANSTVFNTVTRRQFYCRQVGRLFLPKRLKIEPRRTARGNFFYKLTAKTNVKLLNFQNEIFNLEFGKGTTLFIRNGQFVRSGQIIGQPITEESTTRTPSILARKEIQSQFSGEVFSDNNKVIDSKNNDMSLTWILKGRVIEIPSYFKVIQKNNQKLEFFDSIAIAKLVNEEKGKLIFENSSTKQVKNTPFSIQFLFDDPLFQSVGVYKILLASKISSEIFYGIGIKDKDSYFFIIPDFSQTNLKEISTKYRTKTGGLIKLIQKKSEFRKENKKLNTTTGGLILFLPEENLLGKKRKATIKSKVKKVVKKEKLKSKKKLDKRKFRLKLPKKNYSLNDVRSKIILSKNLRRKTFKKIEWNLLEIGFLKKRIKQVQFKKSLYIILKGKEKFFLNLDRNLFYPGELLLNVYPIRSLTFAKIVTIKNKKVLLLRPITLYQIPRANNKKVNVCDKIVLPKFNYNSNSRICKKTNLFEVDLIISEEMVEKSNFKISSYYEFSISKNPDLTFDFKYNFYRDVYSNDDLFEDLKIKTLFISPLVGIKQIVEPETIIFKLEVISNFATVIRSIETINQGNSQRILLVSKNDIKTFFTEERNLVVEQKNSFLLAGSPIMSDGSSGESVKIVKNMGNKLVTRISKPYLISNTMRKCFEPRELIKANITLGYMYYKRGVSSDIVQGIPKIERVLEARKPKSRNKYAKRTGIVLDLSIGKNEMSFSFMDRNETYKINATGKFNENRIKAGFKLCGRGITNAPDNPHMLLKGYNVGYRELFRHNCYFAAYRSLKRIQSYIFNKIQGIYYEQGVEIADKHLEVIVKQMTSKVMITNRGDSSILVGELVELNQAKIIDYTLTKSKLENILFSPILLGITKASLMAESFISSASFQETVRVLTTASIEGKVDWLYGLKENVIVGKIIPAGTGFTMNSHKYGLTMNMKLSEKAKEELINKRRLKMKKQSLEMKKQSLEMKKQSLETKSRVPVKKAKLKRK
uniref:RNA polymerase beta'' subunit n=1 Tax=Haramonas pauciplastida TaxID=478668 RepID=UPI002115C6B2|nr:RNA polymerase beta'' subunit [Haramonas pauciplastida]UTE95004.1 RNA polymerase beta'' subunit [Haramonas pauciplastida]